MSDSLEDLLAAARTQVTDLQAENQTQADLLTEASTNLDARSTEVTDLTSQVESLTTERDEALGQVDSLNTRITELEASQADFDTRVQTEVARVVAATGTSTPARVTPDGDDAAPAADASLEDLVARYDKLIAARQPEEAAHFYQKHLAPLFNR